MNPQTRNAIIRRWHQNHSLRSIARELHLSRETVRRVIDQYQQHRDGADSPAPGRKRRPSKVDRFEPQIVRLLARYPKITVQRIFEELRREGYDGGTSIAFEHLGGVAASCLYDNMKVVVSRYEDGEPVYNPRFLAFATHYGFRPIACRVRRPQTKGKVERPFDYVEKNLLNGREFRSLEHLNDVTRWWLENVADIRIHGTTKQRPIDRHAEEQPHLIELPAHPYDVAEVVHRTVDVEGFVHWRGNRYSVPWQATRPGALLPIKITEDELIIYGREIEEIARHVLLPSTAKKQDQVRPEHRPPRNRRIRREKIRSELAELGEIGERFLVGLKEAHRDCWRQAENVLALLATYHRRDLVVALERAIERRIGEARFADVKRLEDFDWTFNAESIQRSQIEELATGEFVRRGDNLVMVGQSGVGKSHLLQALGRRHCSLGYRVRYTTSASLIQDLTASLADQTLASRLRYWSRFDLLIIDEFGFDKVERQMCDQAASLLYKVLDARSGRRSTALATNVDFEAWAEYLGDPPLAMAFLDRVVDGAIILKIKGKSYRVERIQKAPE